MRRKLHLSRETLRFLENAELEKAWGGEATVISTATGTIVYSVGSCRVSCGGTCQHTCFVC